MYVKVGFWIGILRVLPNFGWYLHSNIILNKGYSICVCEQKKMLNPF